MSIFKKRSSYGSAADQVLLYKRMVDFTGDGVYRYEAKSGKLLFMNKGFLNIIDVDASPERMLGRTLDELIHYVEEPGVVRRAVLDRGEIHGFEYHFRTLKGEPKWVIHDSFATEDPETGEKVVEAIVKDITSIKMAEMKLSRLNSVLKAVRNINQLIVQENDRGRLLERAVEIMVTDGGYDRSGMVIFNEDRRPDLVVESGEGRLVKDVADSMASGDVPAFIKDALENGSGHLFFPAPHEVGIEDGTVRCMFCLLGSGDQVFGLFGVAVNEQRLEMLDEDRSLFAEVSGDISFALANIFLQSEREEAYERLEGYRVRLEMLLQERQKQFEIVGKATPYGVWISNARGGVEYLSESFLQMLGMSLDEVKQKGWTHALSPDKAERMISDWKKCLKEGDKWEREYDVRSAAGEWRSVLSRGFPVRDQKGRITSWVGMHLDVTERKAMFSRLEMSRKYLDKIINTIADPVFVKDRDHRWILLNDALCEFMGHSREELLGKSDYDFFPKEEADIFWEKDESVFESGEENVNEEKFTDADGQTHTIITKKTLYRDEDGENLLVGVIRDITARKAMEEELQESEARYRVLFDKNPAATALVEEDLAIVMSNTRLAELLGCSGEDISGGRNLLDFIYADFHDKVRRYHQLRLIDPSAPPEGYEVVTVGPSGFQRQVVLTISTVPYTRESIVSFLDITELKHKEFELNKKREILDSTNKALEHKVSELQDAMKHIKRLEGLVPICANCKKMLSNEKRSGEPKSWVPLEEYITERTEAKFTHGLCPVCVSELYGRKIKEKNDK